MKRIHLFYFVLTILCTFSCVEKYEYDTTFSLPTALSSPASVTLDVTSLETIVLEWSGGGATDGSIVQYEVLFVAENGNFDNPIQTMPSDLGALPKLTLSHAQLNAIARRAGITTMQTGVVKWTVTASKAGDVKRAEITKTISVTRGEGIDNIPETLYLFGSGAAAEGEARAFRRAEEGVFHIYTNLADGDIHFRNTPNNATGFSYFVVNGKLTEGNGNIAVQATVANTPVRIKVDFNALTVTMQTISNVRCIWGANYGVIGAMTYVSNGIFRADNREIRFIDQSRPETNPPSWLGWIEERYYFIVAIDGTDHCWGRMDGISIERPLGNEPVEFYEIGEFAWSQWDHLWKMNGDLDLKHCDIIIYTNNNGKMFHTFTNIR